MSRCNNAKDHSYTWKIENFFEEKDKASYLLSPNFTAKKLDNTVWFLKMCPNVKGFVEFYLNRIGSEGNTARIQFTISIVALNISSNVSKKATAKSFNTSNDNNFGFARFISYKDLLSKRNVYFPENTLTVHCYMVCKNFLDEITVDDSKTEIEQDLNLKSMCMCNDFLRLYLDSEHCDVKIQTNDRVFSVHKTVLCAKSPVFDAMFKNETKEKISGLVEITDIDTEIVNYMLLFMYSNSFEDISLSQAGKLYAAAEKYQILRLKKKCSFLMKSSLSDTNLYDVYEHGDLFQDSDLKAAVENYLFVYSNKIFESNEWKDFMKSNPRLSSEIMHKLWVKQIND